MVWRSATGWLFGVCALVHVSSPWVTAETIPDAWETESELGLKIGFEVRGLPAGSRVFLEKAEVPRTFFAEGGTVARFETRPVEEKFAGRAYSFTVRVEYVAPGRGERVWERRVRASSGQRVLLEVLSNSSPAFPPPSVRTAQSPQSRVAETEGKRGRLRLWVTLDTRVFINGHLTVQEGEIRDFVTPPIPEGQVYEATIKFDFRNKTGRRIIRTHTVEVPPGGEVEVRDLEGLVEELAP